jgi:hypothetical protein
LSLLSDVQVIVPDAGVQREGADPVSVGSVILCDPVKEGPRAGELAGLDVSLSLKAILSVVPSV